MFDKSCKVTSITCEKAHGGVVNINVFIRYVQRRKRLESDETFHHLQTLNKQTSPLRNPEEMIKLLMPNVTVHMHCVLCTHVYCVRTRCPLCDVIN